MVKLKLVKGQPTRRSVNQAKTASDYFRMGRASAALDQKQKEAVQSTQMSMVQQVMAQNAANQLKDVLAEVNRQQQGAAMASAVPQMPMSAGLPPGGIPPMPPGIGLPGGVPPMPQSDPGSGLPPYPG